MFIAAVACTLFGLGILGATHERRLWQDTIGPQTKPKVLAAVFDGVEAPGSHLALLILLWPVAVALVAVAFQLIVRCAPANHRPYRWASFGSALVVIGWIGESLIFVWYERSFADFRTSIGCLEVFIFLARYFYIAAIVLLVAMELDELVRLDTQRPRNRQELLPLVTGVIRG